jgi:hypothetical protein
MGIQLKDYFRMVDEWQAILQQPLAAQEKQDACLAVLRRYINRIALSHARHVKPALRFYVDMLRLQTLLTPRGYVDELRALAVAPAYFVVSDWIRENQFHQRADGGWYGSLAHAEQTFAMLYGAARASGSVTKN